jgi:hypothetical protein
MYCLCLNKLTDVHCTNIASYPKNSPKVCNTHINKYMSKLMRGGFTDNIITYEKNRVLKDDFKCDLIIPNKVIGEDNKTITTYTSIKHFMDICKDGNLWNDSEKTINHKNDDTLFMDAIKGKIKNIEGNTNQYIRYLAIAYYVKFMQNIELKHILYRISKYILPDSIERRLLIAIPVHYDEFKSGIPVPIKEYSCNYSKPDIPEYNIDLDDPEKWTPLVKRYRDKILHCYNTYFKVTSESRITRDEIIKRFENSLYKDEIKSIAHSLYEVKDKTDPKNLDYYLTVMRIQYVADVACISNMFKKDGRYLHYRSLEWPASDIADITVKLHFQRKNKTVFTSISCLGQVGFITGMSNQGYSLAFNYLGGVILNGDDKNFIPDTTLFDQKIIDKIKRDIIGQERSISNLYRYVMENEFKENQVEYLLSKIRLLNQGFLSICRSEDPPSIIVRSSNGIQIIKENKCITFKDSLVVCNSLPNEDCVSIDKIQQIIKDNINNWDSYNKILNSFIGEGLWSINIYSVVIDPKKMRMEGYIKILNINPLSVLK